MRFYMNFLQNAKRPKHHPQYKGVSRICFAVLALVLNGKVMAEAVDTLLLQEQSAAENAATIQANPSQLNSANSENSGDPIDQDFDQLRSVLSVASKEMTLQQADEQLAKNNAATLSSGTNQQSISAAILSNQDLSEHLLHQLEPAPAKVQNGYFGLTPADYHIGHGSALEVKTEFNLADLGLNFCRANKTKCAQLIQHYELHRK